MKTAEVGQGNHLTCVRWLDSAAVWRILPSPTPSAYAPHDSTVGRMRLSSVDAIRSARSCGQGTLEGGYLTTRWRSPFRLAFNHPSSFQVPVDRVGSCCVEAEFPSCILRTQWLVTGDPAQGEHLEGSEFRRHRWCRTGSGVNGIATTVEYLWRSVRERQDHSVR